jgi:RimJ/RimL family protein N-acetyltransferase
MCVSALARAHTLLAMQQRLPLGEELTWTPAGRPVREPLRGAHVLVRPILPEIDAEPLFIASHPADGDRSIWTYLPDGPYEDPAQLRRMLEWAADAEDAEDAVYFALVPLPGETPLGIAAYLRITPDMGVIEIGHIWFGARLARTTAATEAIYLLARHAFDDLGYRRLEWKCNSLNAASRGAAERFGFTFEGVFRKHQIVKGRNRDTAWFSITDDEWPAIRGGYEAWLAPASFDDDGRQRRTLGESIGALRNAAS